MSDLLKQSFAKAQLARLPPELPIMDSFDETEELEDGSSASSASSASSTGTIKPSPRKRLFERPRASATSRTSLTPLPWNDFFTQELSFQQELPACKITHHAYLTRPSPGGPLIVTHHGAGSSGLSFAAFSREFRAVVPAAGFLSIDARGHGKTTQDPPPSEGIPDLSLETLSSDLAFVVHATQSDLQWPDLPDIVLMGHSLGGAVTTELARSGKLGSKVLAYIVLDVVEGSAMDALQSMDTYLSTRPKGFPSLSSAIEWHLRSRTIRDRDSARVSVPALLEHHPDTPGSSPSSAPLSTSPSTPSLPRPTRNPHLYTFLTPLSLTKPFWPDWFASLSSKFLTAIPSAGKLLLLAGTDRLDKELMIGQMQGKYQLQVFPEAGHFLHEDLPAKVAGVVGEFWKRNERAGVLVLPPKVGADPEGRW